MKHFIFLFIIFMGCVPSAIVGKWKVIDVSFEDQSHSESSIAAETWVNNFINGTVLDFETDSVSISYQEDYLTRYAYEYNNGRVVIQVPNEEGVSMVGSISNDTLRLASKHNESTVMLLVRD